VTKKNAAVKRKRTSTSVTEKGGCCPKEKGGELPFEGDSRKWGAEREKPAFRTKTFWEEVGREKGKRLERRKARGRIYRRNKKKTTTGGFAQTPRGEGYRGKVAAS